MVNRFIFGLADGVVVSLTDSVSLDATQLSTFSIARSLALTENSKYVVKAIANFYFITPDGFVE